MLEGKNFLFHSCLSSSLNIGLISPEYLINKIWGKYKMSKSYQVLVVGGGAAGLATAASLKKKRQIIRSCSSGAI